eukprot:178433_1
MAPWNDAHRTCCVSHDEPGQAALTNPVLQNYLHCNLYTQADKAVRVGDVTQFTSVLSKTKKIFEKDRTHTLLIRLRRYVLKTGVRNISLSYSSISLADIVAKLELGSGPGAEHILAIYDGVIRAVIDKTGWFIFSKIHHKFNDGVCYQSFPDSGVGSCCEAPESIDHVQISTDDSWSTDHLQHVLYLQQLSLTPNQNRCVVRKIYPHMPEFA